MKRAIVHSLAVVLIIAASMAIWHWRFVVDPGTLPETQIAEPLVGWMSMEHEQYEVVVEEGEPVLKLHRNQPTEKAAGVRIWYGPLENVRFIHVRCESRWQDVVAGKDPWLIARFIAHMRDPSGRVMHPPAPRVTGGSGSADWHKSEVVYKLTSDMTDFGFAIAMLGNSGTFEVRNLSIVAVRQRPWVPVATMIVVIGGLALCTSLIRSHPNRPDVGRSLLAASFLVVATWILVFPQTKGYLYPIPSAFAVGEIDPPAPPEPEVKPPPPVLVPTPTEPKIPAPEMPAPPPKVATEALPKTSPHTTSAPEPRDSSWLYRSLKEVDNRVGPAHLVLFTGLTLLILTITGRGEQWRLPLALALLSEIIPELTDHLGGWDDWTDLFANIAGVGIAVLLWLRIPFFKRFQQQPIE